MTQATTNTAVAEIDGAEAPAWLAVTRQAALEQFKVLGYPTTRNEDWHFTSVAPIAEADFPALRAVSGQVTAAQLAPYTFGAEGWHRLVFVNGRFDASLSACANLPEGVTVMELSRAFTEAEELVRGKLGTIATADVEAFTALNAANLLDGALIHVRKGVEVAQPIHLLFVTDATAARGAMHPRVLVTAERHAKVTVIESHAGLGEASYFTNAVTEIDIADGATVTHLKLQRESRRAYHVHTVTANQGRDSHLVSFSFAAGGALVRTNVWTRLAGEGCGATLNGLTLADGEQHVDHQTQIVHVEPNCYSRELYKHVLDDASHGVFNGKVYVHPEAQKTDGKQENHTLLLSDRAHIDTKPQLEIFADDVKCTHGATVGRLDRTSAFYMKSRGIGAELARRLLVYAFAADALETIENETVRESLEALVLERFTA